MKKIVWIAVLLTIFLSCTKEKGGFGNCGTVIEKFIKHAGNTEIKYFLMIEKNNMLYERPVGLIEYNETNIYDSYCGDL